MPTGREGPVSQGRGTDQRARSALVPGKQRARDGASAGVRPLLPPTFAGARGSCRRGGPDGSCFVPWGLGHFRDLGQLGRRTRRSVWLLEHPDASSREGVGAVFGEGSRDSSDRAGAPGPLHGWLPLCTEACVAAATGVGGWVEDGGVESWGSAVEAAPGVSAEPGPVPPASWP